MRMAHAQARDALTDLQWHWGEAYLITGMGRQWLAQRRDDGQTLTAGGPEELRTLIIEDYTARPVAVPEAGS